MRIAHATGTPVVPRGAGTGLAGGAIASPGAIVLDVSRMNRILEISEADELAVVEPGVLNGDLNDALAPLGLWFAPDPASRAISSIGGNIATNAGGLLCAKYGVTREAVLGLTVVLADGRLLRTGHRTVKGVTGYDLTALMTGSEGTLGVIVEATVRLRPVVPGEVVTVGAAFPDVEAAAAASAAVTAARIRPAMHGAPRRGRRSRGVAAYLGATGARGHAARDDRPGRGVPARAERRRRRRRRGRADRRGVRRRRRAGHAVDGCRGGRAAPRDPPRDAPGARRLAGRCSSRTSPCRARACPRCSARSSEIGARYGIEIPTIAHAGDGNLHPNFVFARRRGARPSVWAAADDLFRDCRRASAARSPGEHGVGMLKRRWLADELGDDSFELQRGIKALFDPTGHPEPGRHVRGIAG